MSFCGGKPNIKKIDGMASVCCEDCNATMLNNYISLIDLIAMWNKRAGNCNTTASLIRNDDFDYVCSNCNTAIDSLLESDNGSIDISAIQFCPHCGASIVKLKHIEPCPFCDKTPVLHTSKLTDFRYGYSLRCGGGCLCSPSTSYYHTIDEAIVRWNDSLKKNR